MIKIFTSPTCPYCQTAKEFFKAKGLEFLEVDASTETGRDELILSSGQMTIPVIIIDGEVIVGFDLMAIKKKLNL